MKLNRNASLALLAIVGVLLLSACAPTPSPFVESPGTSGQVAGFLMGLWHGFALLFMFIASLFVDTVGIYEVHNTGWSYNLGFLMGVMIFFSGGGKASGRREDPCG